MSVCPSDMWAAGPVSETSFAQTLQRQEREEEDEGECGLLTGPIKAKRITLTLKVHQAVSVEVHISEDLVDLSVGHLFSHQLLHGLTQLI